MKQNKIINYFKDIDKSKASMLSFAVFTSIIFFFCDFISTIVDLFFSFLMLKLYCAIKKKIKIEKIKWILGIYYIFELLAVVTLLANRNDFGLFATVCVLIILGRTIVGNKETIGFFSQISLLSVLFFILTFLSSLKYAEINNISFYSFDISDIFLILSIFFSCVSTMNDQEYSKKEINVGFFVGGAFLAVVCLIETFLFGQKYVFSKNPILLLADLSIIPIKPFAQCFLLLLIIIRETFFLRTAYNLVRNRRRKSIEKQH